MPFPLIPVAVTLGAAGLGYLLFGDKKAEAAPAPVLPPAQPYPPVMPQMPPMPQMPQIPGMPAPLPAPSEAARIPPSGVIIMPDALRRKYNSALRNADDPMVNTDLLFRGKVLAELPIVANELQNNGFMHEANELRTKQAQVLAKPLPGLPSLPAIIPQPLPAPAPGPAPAPAPAPLPSLIDILPAILPIPPIVPPTPIEPTGMTATVIGTPGANLRGNPSTTGAIIVGVLKGVKVKILDPIPVPPTAGAPRGWFRVSTPAGQTGYMSAEFIQIDGLPSPLPLPGPSPAPLPMPSAFGNAKIVANPGANLRKEPNANGAILIGLFSGTRVKVINPTRTPPTAGAPKGWLQLQTQSGLTGYVSAEYVIPDSGTVFTGERRNGNGMYYDHLPGGEGLLNRKHGITG